MKLSFHNIDNEQVNENDGDDDDGISNDIDDNDDDDDINDDGSCQTDIATHLLGVVSTVPDGHQLPSDDPHASGRGVVRSERRMLRDAPLAPVVVRSELLAGYL